MFQTDLYSSREQVGLNWRCTLQNPFPYFFLDLVQLAGMSSSPLLNFYSAQALQSHPLTVSVAFGLAEKSAVAILGPLEGDMAAPFLFLSCPLTKAQTLFFPVATLY